MLTNAKGLLGYDSFKSKFGELVTLFKLVDTRSVETSFLR